MVSPGVCCWCPMERRRLPKWLYLGLLLVCTLALSALSLEPTVSSLQQTFGDFNATCRDLRVSMDNCRLLTGHLAVYKVSFSFGFFFIVMAVTTTGVTSDTGLRAGVHNNLWLLKLLLLTLFTLATFVSPVSQLEAIYSFWINVTLVGNVVFMWLQTVCLIDVSSLVILYLSNHMSNSMVTRVLLVCLTGAVLLIWMIVVVVMVGVHGTQNYCLTKMLVLVASVFAALLLLVAALTPCARDPSASSMTTTTTMTSVGRVLQASTVCLLLSFWTWCALQSAPESAGILEVALLKVSSDDLFCLSSTNPLVQTCLDLVIITLTLATVLYLTSDAAEIKTRRGFAISESFLKNIDDADHTDLDTYQGPVTRQDSLLDVRRHRRGESVHIMYSYSFFHTCLALGIMHITIQLTNGLSADDLKCCYRPDRSWATMAFRLATGWSCCIVYLCFLFLPNQWLSAVKRSEESDENEDKESTGRSKTYSEDNTSDTTVTNCNENNSNNVHYATFVCQRHNVARTTSCYSHKNNDTNHVEEDESLTHF